MVAERRLAKILEPPRKVELRTVSLRGYRPRKNCKEADRRTAFKLSKSAIHILLLSDPLNKFRLDVR